MKSLLLSAFACFASTLQAATFTYYVDSKKGDDGNDGLTPDAAYLTIARALENLPTTQTTDNDYVFRLADSDVDYTWGGGVFSVGVSPRVDGVKFYGNREHPERVRLNGQGARGFLKTNSQRYEIAGCTFVTTLGGAIVFNNRTNQVEDCVFAGCTNSANGGALSFSYETTVARCRFSDCYSAKAGGAVNSGGNAGNLIYGCLFERNVCGETGGALRIDHVDSVVSNCVFVSNESKGVAVAYGGGALAGTFCRLYGSCFTNNVSAVHGGHVRMGQDANWAGFVTNCVFYGGDANSDGGAVIVNFAGGRVVDCTFEQNNAKVSTAALSLKGKRTEVVACRFFDNGWDKTSLRGACGAGSLTNVLVGCVFSNNYGKNDGGAVYVSNTCIFEAADCLFVTNSCTLHGGAVVSSGNAVAPVFSNCVFAGNVSVGTGGALFGGAALYDCVFTNNVSQSGGAAHFNDPSRAVGCTFCGNESTVMGGGLYCTAAGCAFTNCVFASNVSAAHAGGGLCGNAAGLSVYGCRFDRNSCTGTGCGLCIFAAGDANKPHLIRNCLFTANGHATANAKGGGLYIRDHTFVDGCTFVNNFRRNGAGGLCFGSIDDVRVSNCLFYGNTDVLSATSVWHDIGAEDAIRNAFSTYVDHCAVWKAYSGFVDGENGNRLLTVSPFVDYAGGDYHLAKGSSCVDAGQNAAWMAGAFDFENLRRRPRLVDGNGDGIATVDLGCYEYRPTPGMVLIFR